MIRQEGAWAERYWVNWAKGHPSQITRQEVQLTLGRYLCELEIAVDEGPFQELLDGGNPHLLLLIHEDLVEITVLDFLSCRSKESM